ncbi:MAG: DMT family transporter [Gemmatimonadales bacterium]|nr:MAG: DMT family transporter [Gemmatimonadales bacterium]
MKPRDSSRLLAFALITLAVLSWSGNALLGRALHQDIPPVALAFWRWALATTLLLPFAWRYLWRDRAALWAGWPLLLLLSVLGVSTFNTLLYHAAHTTTATNIALMQTAMPAAIVALDLLLFRRRPAGRGVAGAFLAMAGAAVVVLRGDPRSLLALDLVEGDLWMMLAVLAYALYSILIPRRPPSHMLAFLGATFVAGTILLLPLFLWERAVQGPHEWNAGIVAAILYVAVFPSILAYLFWNRGVETVGAGQTGLFICLMPVFTAALAVPLLGERLAPFHLAGFVLIVAGIFLFRDGAEGKPSERLGK